MRPFVLVHGAWHGGWCWARVTERLETAGRRVFAPSLPGCGERAGELSRAIGLDSFYDTVIDLIVQEDLRDVVLVGHSAGGAVVPTPAARLADRVSRLVFLDAHIPFPGESLLDLSSPEVAEGRRIAAQAYDGGISLPVPPPAFFGVTDPADAAWMAPLLTPHPLKPMEDPLPADAAIPDATRVAYIRCTDPLYDNVEKSAERARNRADWRYDELATGHNAMVSAPDELTALLLELADT